MEKHQALTLASLVRRTDNTAKLKLIISSTGASLSRKGRSRNWTLSVTNHQISEICRLIRVANEPSWLWVVKVVSDQRPQTDYSELLNLVRANRKITINELMTISNCSVLDARKAFDEIEWEE